MPELSVPTEREAQSTKEGEVVITPFPRFFWRLPLLTLVRYAHVPLMFERRWRLTEAQPTNLAWMWTVSDVKSEAPAIREKERPTPMRNRRSKPWKIDSSKERRRGPKPGKVRCQRARQ